MSIVNAKQQQQHSVEITKFYSHNFLQEFCEINFVIRRITMVIAITKCFSRMRVKFCFFHTVQVQQMGLTLSANIYFDQIGIQYLLLYIFTANWAISIKTNLRRKFLKVLTLLNNNLILKWNWKPDATNVKFCGLIIDTYILSIVPKMFNKEEH